MLHPYRGMPPNYIPVKIYIYIYIYIYIAESRFSKQDWPSDEFGLGEPSHSQNVLAEMCNLYRKTRYLTRPPVQNHGVHRRCVKRVQLCSANNTTVARTIGRRIKAKHIPVASTHTLDGAMPP